MGQTILAPLRNSLVAAGHFVSMQVHEALQMSLQVASGRTREDNTVVVTQVYHGVAVCISGDERCELLKGLNVGEVVELHRIRLRIKVDDSIGADAGLENEAVVARASDRYRHGLLHVYAGILVGNADLVRLCNRLARCKVELVVAKVELPCHRSTAVAFSHRSNGKAAEVAGAPGRHILTQRIGRSETGKRD